MNKPLAEKVLNLAYGSAAATAAEKEISELLKLEGNSEQLQILLLQAQMAAGETERTELTANRIWDYGEELPPDLQCCYARNLTALGKLEMAQRMIYPLIEADFSAVAATAIDYIVMSGDNQMAEILLTSLPDENVYNLVNNYISINDKNNYWKILQKQGEIIYEVLKREIVGISCRLFQQKDNNTAVEMNLYIRQNENKEDIQRQLEEKLVAKKIPIIGNLFINIEGITHCPSMAQFVRQAA